MVRILVVAGLVLGLPSLAVQAQQFDIDMSGTDSLSRGGSVSVTRSSPNLGAGPQLDLSGGLADTIGSGGSCNNCQNNGSFSTVDKMKSQDLLNLK